MTTRIARGFLLHLKVRSVPAQSAEILIDRMSYPLSGAQPPAWPDLHRCALLRTVSKTLRIISRLSPLSPAGSENLHTLCLEFPQGRRDHTADHDAIHLAFPRHGNGWHMPWACPRSALATSSTCSVLASTMINPGAEPKCRIPRLQDLAGSPRGSNPHLRYLHLCTWLPNFSIHLATSDPSSFVAVGVLVFVKSHA